jgi:head-tail adaptor
MSRIFSRHLLLERATWLSDGAGGQTRDWTVIGGLWAEVRMRSGGVSETEFGRLPRLRLRVATPALPVGEPMRPVPGDRLRDGTRIYAVTAAHEADGRGRVLTVLAEEEVAP